MVEPLIAQASALERVLPWVLGLILLSLAAGGALMMLRKRLFGVGDEDEMPPLMISELRKLRDEGRLSNEEYEQARSAIIANTKEQAPSRPVSLPQTRSTSERVAPPGLDLTGERLPNSSDPGVGDDG